MKHSNRLFSILIPVSLALILALAFMAITPQGRARRSSFYRYSSKQRLTRVPMIQIPFQQSLRLSPISLKPRI